MYSDQCKYYTIYAQDVKISGEVMVQPNCIEWLAVNLGDDPVRVNNVYLLPRLMAGLSGASFSPEPNEDELWANPLNVIFMGTGANPWVQIIQRFYVTDSR